MRIRGIGVALAALAIWAATPAAAYPGGTPQYQTDVAPYCASCHASLDAAALRGAGDRATKELADNKHLAQIEAGAPQTPYADMSPAERAELVKHIRALDAASTVRIEVPETVAPGALFTVRVRVTGGAGPVVGVGLVSRDHRWYARPAPSVGWSVAAPPQVIGQNDDPQTEWLDARPPETGRNLAFVNITGVKSDAATGQWAKGQVNWQLRAPNKPGRYPLGAVYLYGTEKASPFGVKKDALGRAHPRGGFTGASGRVVFTPVREIEVRAP